MMDQAGYSLKRIWTKACISMAKSPMLPSGVRVRLWKLGGIKLRGYCFIGSDVELDGIFPDFVEFGNGCTLTSGVRILTHYYNPSTHRYYYGRVTIGDGVFIGINSLIINSVNIGDRAVIGAGSVVNCDIPAGEVWAGNPARFIKKLD